MPRKREVQIRSMVPDPVYGSQLVTKFINNIMERGKKSLAESIFYDAMKKIEHRTKEEPLRIFKTAVENVKPTLEVKVAPRRRQSLAIRWILTNAKARGEKTMADRLANELIDAFNNRGAAMKKKEDTHRMAEANKAFAHYRW